MRGEDYSIGFGCGFVLETPPRVWGRLDTEFRVVQNLRNTPTCVGKTTFYAEDGSSVQKHPHVRGEDTEGLFTFFAEPSKQY